jgi:hypothetical protein
MNAPLVSKKLEESGPSCVGVSQHRIYFLSTLPLNSVIYVYTLYIFRGCEDERGELKMLEISQECLLFIIVVINYPACILKTKKAREPAVLC